MRINHFFLFSKLNCGAIFDFWNHDDARNIKSGNWEQQIAKNGKLQYLYQKQFQSRRMLKSRVPLENISRVLLNLIKRWIFVMFKNASPPNVHAVNSHVFSLDHQLRLVLALTLFPCFTCLASIIICIFKFTYRTFEDCIGLWNVHYCCSCFRIFADVVYFISSAWEKN